MISDTLAGAGVEIDRYVKDSGYKDNLQEINNVRVVMQALRIYFDLPYTPDDGELGEKTLAIQKALLDLDVSKVKDAVDQLKQTVSDVRETSTILKASGKSVEELKAHPSFKTFQKSGRHCGKLELHCDDPESFQGVGRIYLDGPCIQDASKWTEDKISDRWYVIAFGEEYSSNDLTECEVRLFEWWALETGILSWK